MQLKDEDLMPKHFAATFGRYPGDLVLAHLRKMTLERSLGPEASSDMLRYLEGQRALVNYIASMTARGSEPA
jgi:hypothetical protein